MKKSKIVVYALVITLVAVSFIGCSKESDTPDTPAPDVAEESELSVNESDKREVKGIMKRKFATEEFNIDVILADSFRDLKVLEKAKEDLGLETTAQTKNHLKKKFKNSDGFKMIEKTNKFAKLDTLEVEANQEEETIIATMDFEEKEGEVVNREFQFKLNKNDKWYLQGDLEGLVGYIEMLEEKQEETLDYPSFINDKKVRLKTTKKNDIENFFFINKLTRKELSERFNFELSGSESFMGGRYHTIDGVVVFFEYFFDDESDGSEHPIKIMTQTFKESAYLSVMNESGKDVRQGDKPAHVKEVLGEPDEEIEDPGHEPEGIPPSYILKYTLESEHLSEETQLEIEFEQDSRELKGFNLNY